MVDSTTNNQLLKQLLATTKTIAMVGVSLINKKETSNIIRRRPSIIVMKYLQEFGYRVIPVNPSSAGKTGLIFRKSFWYSCFMHLFAT